MEPDLDPIAGILRERDEWRKMAERSSQRTLETISGNVVLGEKVKRLTAALEWISFNGNRADALKAREALGTSDSAPGASND